jgi:hypothetical protein
MKEVIKQFFTRRLMGFYSGGIMSYSAGYIFTGKETGVKGILPSIIIHISHLEIHLHHWLWSSLILFFLVIPLFWKKKINAPLFLFIFGFCLGLIVHGVFSYADWKAVFSLETI